MMPFVKLGGAGGVDQGHDALLDPVLGQELVLDPGQDIDKGVADADHVKALTHAVFSS
jgi:hypothetical protein